MYDCKRRKSKDAFIALLFLQLLLLWFFINILSLAVWQATVEGLEQGYCVVSSTQRFLLLFTFLKKNIKKKVLLCASYEQSCRWCLFCWGSHIQISSSTSVKVLDMLLEYQDCCICKWCKYALNLQVVIVARKTFNIAIGERWGSGSLWGFFKICLLLHSNTCVFVDFFTDNGLFFIL